MNKNEKGFCTKRRMITFKVGMVMFLSMSISAALNGGNAYSKPDLAFRNTYLVQIEITGGIPFDPAEDSWLARAHKNEQLVVLKGVIREVYNGPANLVGQIVSLASPQLVPPENGTLINTYSFDGVTVKGKEPVGARAIVPLVFAAAYRDTSTAHKSVLAHEFPYRSVFSIAHTAGREIVWDRAVGPVTYYPHLYESALKWAQAISLYNRIEREDERIQYLMKSILSDNSLLSVSSVHILFRDYYDAAQRIAKQHMYHQDVSVVAKIALDHELTLSVGDAWRQGGQIALSQDLDQHIHEGTEQQVMDVIKFRNAMLKSEQWNTRTYKPIEDEYVWGVKSLPVFEGYLVEGEIDEVVRGRPNILTGKISGDVNNVHDVIVNISQVYVGPKQLENVRFSASGNMSISLDGRQIAIKPVVGVGMGRNAVDGLAVGDKGLWHLVTAIGGHQEAYLGSSLMAARGYGGYIYYDNSSQANAWRMWARILSEILRPDSSPVLDELEELLSHDLPEVSVWACHAIARMLGTRAVDVLFESSVQNKSKNQIWQLIGMDDVFSRILKSWESGSKRFRLLHMLIQADMKTGETETICSYILRTLQREPQWSPEEYLQLYITALKEGVHVDIRRISPVFAIAAMKQSNNSEKIKGKIIDVTRDAPPDIRAIMLNALEKLEREGKKADRRDWVTYEK